MRNGQVNMLRRAGWIERNGLVFKVMLLTGARNMDCPNQGLVIGEDANVARKKRENNMDLAFIIVLGILMMRATASNGIYDFVGCVGASMILYMVVKLPFLIILGGWSWPLSDDPQHQFGSGIVGLLSIGAVLLYAKKKRTGHILRAPIIKD